MNAQVQIIERDGQPEYAVVPIETYRRLLALAEDMEDIRAYDRAMAEIDRGEDEVLPAEVAKRLLSGEAHPLRIWREYRGLTQQQLAQAVGVGKSYISQIEAGKKQAAVGVLQALSRTLAVDMEDLVTETETQGDPRSTKLRDTDFP
jgi:DNA-binding XRE family transcriptional regulator